jgi:hypothetical protein
VPSPPVADLLPEAAVRIDVDSVPSGTGFFVAPGQVMTCAHVIEPAVLGTAKGSPRIQVMDSRGRVHELAREPATDREADLAWLRLLTAPIDVPAVLLFGDVGVGDEVSGYGFPPGKPDGVPATFEVEGYTGGARRLIKFKEGQVQPGMSGAPLLNLRTGAVCGIIPRTRDDRQALGGYGIPVETIERCSFYQDLQGHISQALRAKSLWLDSLTAEQRRLVRSSSAPDEPSSAVEFVINIGQRTEGWVADVCVPPAAPIGPVPVDLNAVRAEVARFFRAWKSQRRIEDAEQARLLGQVLYRAVLPPVLAAELERHMFDTPGAQVNVNLRFAEGTELDLVHLPWEQLYVPAREARGGVAIGQRDRATLTRIVSPQPVEYEPPRSSELSVLLVEGPRQYGASSATDGRNPPIAQEVSAEICKQLGNRADIKIESAGPISAEQLADRLSEDSFTVVHYVGYGRYYGNSDELALSDARGDVTWLGPDDFADLVTAPPTRLVVLQTCTAPSTFVPGDLTVLAKALLGGGVDAVVASQFPMPELMAAIRLVDGLYSHLLDGTSVRMAVQRVRRALRVRPWTQPALFARHPGDLRLLAPALREHRGGGAWRGSAGG